MITPEFLKSCTDEQINKGVAWLEVAGFSLAAPDEQSFIDYHCAITMLTRTLDYCTNPNDACLIILENRIGLKPRGVDNDWYSYQGKVEVINENPLRAAMEVYILMSTQS